MIRRRTVLVVWLIAGAALLAHDVATGGGLAGLLLTQQLNAFGIVAPGLTYIGLALVLCAIPAGLLLPRGGQTTVPSAPVRRMRWIVCVSLSACMGVFSVMAFQQASGVAPEGATIVRFTILGPVTSAALPNDERVMLQGTPQLDHEVVYDELTVGMLGHNLNEAHRLVPLTGPSWTPGQPVYFVTDLLDATEFAGSSLPGTTLRATGPGVIVQSAIPGWVRDAFAERGITLAADARLHTTDWRGQRNSWYAITAMAAVAAVLCMLVGIALR